MIYVFTYLATVNKDYFWFQSHGYSESGEDILDGLNGNVITEQNYRERYRAMRRRSVSDNNILHLHHPISTLYCK